MQEIWNLGVIAVHPCITPRGDDILIALSALTNHYEDESRMNGRALRVFHSTDRGATFSQYPITDKSPNEYYRSITYSSLASAPGRFFCFWTSERTNLDQKHWTTFYGGSADDPMTWGTNVPVNLKPPAAFRFYMSNSIAVNNSGLIEALITRRQDRMVNGKLLLGKWTTPLKSGQDPGNTFTDEKEFYESGVYEAWNPRISFVNADSSDFIVVWEQHSEHQGAEIFCRVRSDSVWKRPRTISLLDGKDSAEPDLPAYQDKAFIGWQDYQDGYWEVKVKGIQVLN